MDTSYDAFARAFKSPPVVMIAALRREDMVVLEIRVASKWKTEDMDREYRSIHERLGPIRQILIDGASELQNGAKA